MLSNQEWKLLRDGCEDMNLHLSEVQYKTLQTYCLELETWNPLYKLVAAEGKDLIINHILDSLSGVSVIRDRVKDERFTLCDLGSGAGLPGIPLAIVFEQAHITLVERMNRRVGFLRNATALCNLVDRVVINEQNLSDVTQTFDVVTFRAFRPLSEIQKDLVRLIPTGFVCAYKGSKARLQEELISLESTGWHSEIISVSVPYLDAERTLCVLKHYSE